MRAWGPVVLASVVVAGCTIETSGLASGPEPEVDAAMTLDAGSRPDAASVDAPRDAGGLDGGDVPSDAGEAMDTGATECEDGVTSCSADGTEVLGCADGRVTRLACPAGCDPGTTDCRVVPPCDLPMHGDLVPGMDEAFTLCGEGNDVAPAWTPECQGGANGEDRIYRMVLDRARVIRLDLRDFDGVAIDTVLYVRTWCEDADSQVACEDDIPCEDADSDFACSGVGTKYRQSIIETELGPGAYFVVADSISRSGWSCGTVRLRYSWP